MIEKTINITGSLRDSDEEGGGYTFSVKAFKVWKEEFQNAYQRECGVPFRVDVPDSKIRESVYKVALGMRNTDAFSSGRYFRPLDEQLFEKVMRVQQLLQQNK